MGIWVEDHRMDCFGITDERVKKNVNGVAAIVFEKDLLDEKNGFSTLKVKNYGTSFNLYEREAFREQPIAAGRLFTGFLVKKNVIATAGSAVDENTVKDLRIVFGYKMSDPYTPVTKIPNENIYKGVKIIHKVLRREVNRSDWALVQLDREVEGQEVAVLSKDEIVTGLPVYVIGHPSGLPLKYAPGAQVRGFKDAFFTADLTTYMGSSGSPVFNADTHEVIGIVVHGDLRDFKWMGSGWGSIIYPRRDIDSKGPHCTKVSEFIDHIDKNNTDIGYVYRVEERQKTKNNIFISYNHKDKEYLDRIVVHLRPLEKDGFINLWIDTKLRAGDKWEAEIKNALKRACAAILLVSADFYASDFIADNELPPLLEKAERDGTRIIPVIVKPCRFTRDKNLSRFQAINDPSKPLIALKEEEQEQIYDRISIEIEALMGED